MGGYGLGKDETAYGNGQAATRKGDAEAVDEGRSARFETGKEWRQAMNEVNDGAKEGHGCLCAILGMFFGPIGLIVAAIIGGAQGVGISA